MLFLDYSFYVYSSWLYQTGKAFCKLKRTIILNSSLNVSLMRYSNRHLHVCIIYRTARPRIQVGKMAMCKTSKKRGEQSENGGWEYCHRSRENTFACVRGGVHDLRREVEPMRMARALRDTARSFSRSRTRSTRGS